MKKLFGVAAAMAMALTGCGPSICEGLEEASEAFGEKYRPCSGSDVTFPINEKCSEDIDQCKDEELEAIADFSECIHKVHRCNPDDPDPFINEFYGCVLDLYDRASEKCLAATGIFGKS